VGEHLPEEMPPAAVNPLGVFLSDIMDLSEIL